MLSGTISSSDAYRKVSKRLEKEEMLKMLATLSSAHLSFPRNEGTGACVRRLIRMCAVESKAAPVAVHRSIHIRNALLGRGVGGFSAFD